MQDGGDPPLERPVLETERLRLRLPDAGDIDAIVAMAGDRDVARRLARIPHPYGRDDARFFLDAIVPREWTWAVAWRASGEVVGMAGLVPGPEPEVAELGYYVARRHWGRGIATEAAGAVVAHGFGVLGLRVINSGYFLDNPASGRVLGKLGFVESGRSERSCLAIDSTVASVEMRLHARRMTC